MSKGGGQPQTTESRVTNTTVAEEFRPYIERTLQRAEGISNRPYEAYQGQRIADFSAPTQQSFQSIVANQGAYQPYMSAAVSGMNSAMTGTANAGSGTARDVTTGQWNTQAAQQYMDPYLDTVLDRARARQERAFGEQMQGLDQKAAMSGAFGGSRHGVMSAIAARDHNDRIMDMEASAMSDAYRQGQSIFGQDQGRMLEAGTANQRADMAGLDRLLAASGQMGQLAGQSADLGRLRSELGYADAEAMRNMGLTQEQLTQAGLDMAYGDFVNQRDFERNNLAFLASLAFGAPTGTSSDVQDQRYANPYAQALGAGLGLFGMGQNMGAR